MVKSESILTWQYVNTNGPWSLIFLMGSGFALAEGSTESGLSEMIANWLTILKPFHHVFILFCVTLACFIMTTFVSNVVAANVVLPIIADLAVAINIHPLYLMLPATLCCSYSFVMAVGSPTNAIVASAVHIPKIEMVRVVKII